MKLIGESLLAARFESPKNNCKQLVSAMKEYSTKDGRVVVIREATEDDLQAIIDLWNSVASEGE